MNLKSKVFSLIRFRPHKVVQCWLWWSTGGLQNSGYLADCQNTSQFSDLHLCNGKYETQKFHTKANWKPHTHHFGPRPTFQMCLSLLLLLLLYHFDQLLRFGLQFIIKNILLFFSIVFFVLSFLIFKACSFPSKKLQKEKKERKRENFSNQTKSKLEMRSNLKKLKRSEKSPFFSKLNCQGETNKTNNFRFLFFTFLHQTFLIQFFPFLFLIFFLSNLGQAAFYSNAIYHSTCRPIFQFLQLMIYFF